MRPELLGPERGHEQVPPERPQQVPPRLGLLPAAQRGPQSPQEQLPRAFALRLAVLPPRARQALGDLLEPLPAVARAPPTVPAVPQTAPELAIDR